MPRITKDPAERKQEILETAYRLFLEKGYEQTVISDIVKAIGVAQGTFYNYFKSKEDIFLALLENIQNETIEKLEEIRGDSLMNALEKLNRISRLELSLHRHYDPLFIQLHLETNSGMHQKYVVGVISKLVPIYTFIIEQGVMEGIFDTEYPKETAEYMLVASKFLFDPGFFRQEQSELAHKIEAAQRISERILGAAKGTLILFDVHDFQ